MDLIERLASTDLFQHLEPLQLAQVAALAREHRVSAGTTLSRQADIGTTFFLIDSGDALVQRVDDKGFARPVGTLRAGDCYGVTSLFVSEPRDATVISRTPMNLWTIERAVFEDLLDREPAIGRAMSVPVHVAARLEMPEFPWLAESERVVLYSHRHWGPLVLTLAAGTLAMALVIGSVIAYLAKRGASWDPTLWLLIPAALYLAFVSWHWFDWLNDQLVVTTQRISYREQVALFYEARNEVPIDRIQNINIISTLLGRVLNYGTVIIETAAQTGTLALQQMPRPEDVRDAIWEQSERSQATRHAAERRLMADALASQLGIDTRERLPDADTPGEAAEHSPDPSEEPAEQATWATRFLDLMRSGGLVPRAVVRTDQVVWRKHPIFLVRSALIPGLATALSALVAVLSWFGEPSLLADRFALYPVVTLVLAMAAGFWLLWAVIDWANDRYMVTDDRIVDVEQRPFSLHSERREASLSVIQNVRFVIPHFWAALWGYGNVVVQTAGTGDFTFDRVHKPAEVQAEIFRRIEAYRERGRQQEAARRRQEMAEWFAVYRELQEPSAAAPSATGDADPPEPDGA
ncbi:MAG: PH domain-containing protein [Chloroflexi bacterium]|nr:PH domain-containing protein [Chloroflexota bacterium]